MASAGPGDGVGRVAHGRAWGLFSVRVVDQTRCNRASPLSIETHGRPSRHHKRRARDGPSSSGLVCLLKKTQLFRAKFLTRESCSPEDQLRIGLRIWIVGGPVRIKKDGVVVEGAHEQEGGEEAGDVGRDRPVQPSGQGEEAEVLLRLDPAPGRAKVPCLQREPNRRGRGEQPHEA